jgi:hypothetical protein
LVFLLLLQSSLLMIFLSLWTESWLNYGLDEPHYFIFKRTSTSQFHPLLYSSVLVFFFILPKAVIMKITFLLRFFNGRLL